MPLAPATSLSIPLQLMHKVLLEEAADWQPGRLDALERALLTMSHTHAGKPTPVYAVAFSEVGDDMAQWDRYANYGIGYSLGFTPEALRTIVRTAPFPDEWNRDLALRRVVYEESAQRAMLRPLLAKGVDLVDTDMERWGATEDRGLATLARYMAPHLLELLSAFKHPGFAAEREWRLTYTGGIHESEGFDSLFRASKRGMIPYVKMAAPHAANRIQRLPMSHVYCGPGLARIEAPQAARGFLLINAYQALPPDVAAQLTGKASIFPRVAVQASAMAR